MSFLLPDGLAADAVRDLERACLSGGPDNMPWPTEVRIEPRLLTVRRTVEESGYLAVPWHVNGAGRLMGTSATLMERGQPYHLLVELARGKINQVRCQAFDWRFGGLQMSEELAQRIREASFAFGRAVGQSASDQVSPQAQTALDLGYQAAEQLVQVYMDQVFEIRHQHQPRLDTTLGCRLGPAVPAKDLAGELVRSCNSVCLPLAWSEVQPTEDTPQWAPYDALLKWATDQKLPVTAGPLLDFSSARLPDWLWLWERDLSSLSSFLCQYVESAVRRYRGRIRRWQIAAASNWATVLSLGEDELLWLTVKVAEAARQVDPGLELAVGIAQPWGEYLAQEDRIHSPFIFADTLIRSGLNLAALDLELVMGVAPRGSYCRDLLEASRLLDLYALLGVPLRVTLGYPSASGADADADPDLRVASGCWHDGFRPDVQANWVSSFAALALSKPYVQGVQWVHFADADPHQFPHCGLVDAKGNVKAALQRLRELREKHLQ